MPVLSEKNQHECVGGYYFVGPNGSGFLETSEGGDLIVVATPQELQAYWDSGTVPVYTSWNSISNQIDSVKEATYLNIALNVDYNAFSGVNVVGNSFDPTVSYENGTLTVNKYGDSGILGFKDAFASAIEDLIITGMQ